MSRGRTTAAVVVALRYLGHRRFASWMSVSAIALSLVFVIGIGLVNFAMKKTAVEGAIRYPLVVGPEGSSAVQLILSTIFHVDKPTGTVPFAAFEKIKADDRVLAAFPVAVADSLEAYPIIGTTQAYLEDFGAGAAAGTIDLSQRGSAVLGAEVAARLEIGVGATFHGTHGMIGGEDADEHEEHAYRVVGVLAGVGGPEDTAVYTDYRAVWQIHGGAGEHEGEEGHEGEAGEHAEDDRYHLEEGALTAVLVRTASPVYTAMLEREWSLEHGTQAVDTGRTVRRLVSYLDKGERLVELFGGVTLAVAIAMILVVIVMSLGERRKELALMRSLGIGRMTIAVTVMVEVLVITLGGCLLGVALGHTAVWWSEYLVKQGLGIAVEPWTVTSMEVGAVLATLAAGQLLALIAMAFTYRLNLVEEIARD
ncbi:MAG: ABC transporter permease [Deltaproteobacteria bacterium]|jgi:putative ABC transport system permease protein|nr:ABC transporter permease [Deltaproteobacteria bacterium]